jgi:single-stranded DNA-binding protein
MVMYATINGRLTKDGRKVKKQTSDGEKDCLDIQFASNTFIKGRQMTTYVKATLWERQFCGMWNDLKKGTAILVGGELYEFKFTNDEGDEIKILCMKVNSLTWPQGNKRQRTDEGGDE